MFDFLKNIYDAVVNPTLYSTHTPVGVIEERLNSSKTKRFLTEKDIPAWADDMPVYNCGWIDENSKLMKTVGKKDSGWLLLEISLYDSGNNRKIFHSKN